MSRALTACFAISIGAAPLGVFLVLRRMTLIGDALSHAILPGVSLAFLIFGVALLPMTLGGLVAGLVVAIIANLTTRLTHLKEDSSFSGIYLLSLAAGVMLVSTKGNAIDLMHILFGNVLAVDNQSLFLVVGITSITSLILAAIYRALIVECFDPIFMKSINGKGALIHQIFLLLVVLNLVSAFQALGTLMALGMILLPAISSRFWAKNIDRTIILSIVIAFCASYFGLLFSYHYNIPSGPSIVLCAGVFYITSIFFGKYGSISAYFFPKKHYTS